MGEANPVQSENSDVKEPTNVTSNSSEEDDDLPF
jgi:hypothetical protein